MTSSLLPHSVGGSLGDCHHHNTGLPDLETIPNHHHHVNTVTSAALTPPPQMPSSPWTISDTNNHCLRLSEKLRVQREQARFADLILSVQGREFPAHRCVLAACSTWFDSKLKVHKCTREHIEIDQCKDYEIFYALLTYCYTGHIVINDTNVPELLHLSNFFGMVKLKSYCCDYLGRHLSVRTVHSVLDQALKYQISDLTKQSMSFLQRHFAYLLHHDHDSLMSYSYNTIQFFLMEKAWSLPQELVLRFIVNWVNADVTSREEFLVQLLDIINWGSISNSFISDHIDSEPLYENPSALHTILQVLDRNNVFLGKRFQEIYQNLQAAQELDELNDSNSFLTLAINSAVKTLEHSEVDPDWFLQGEGHPLPPVVPEQLLTSSGTNIVMPQASTLSQRQERLERYKDSFDLDIFEQVINEQQQLTDERHKFAASTSAAKRYDPKFRALTEAIRLMEEEEEGEGECEMPPPSSASPKMTNTISYPPHPKQRHLSNSLAFLTAPSNSQRGEMRVRSDGVSADYLPTSQNSHRAGEMGVRNDGLSGDYLPSTRIRTDGLSSGYLGPPSQSSHREGMVGVRNDGMPTDFLPSSQPMEHEVPFEASALMVDYDFIVPEVTTPPPPDEEDIGVPDDSGIGVSVTGNEIVNGTKYFAPRHFENSDAVSTHMLNDSDEFMQQQPQEQPAPPQQHQEEISEQTEGQQQHQQQQQSDQLQFDKNEADDPVYAVEGKKQKASKLQRLSSLQEASDAQMEKVTLATSNVSQNRHVKKAKLLSSAEHRNNSELSSNETKAMLLPKARMRRKPQLTCPLCSYTTRFKSRMEVHAKYHEKVGSSPSSCPFCDFQCSWRLELRLHVKKTHGGPPYICPVCSHSTKKLYQLLTHSHVHSTEEKFVCNVEGCDFATNTTHRLKFHKQSKHRKETFECQKCGKSFGSKQTLRTHQLVHVSNDLKSFSCDECDFSTKYSNHLALHKKIHRGEVFRCSVDPNCRYTTPKLVHLKNHERAHKGEKQFSCDQCDKSFVEKSQLTRHARIHSDATPFSCTRCEFKTKRRDKLKNHLLRIHKESL